MNKRMFCVISIALCICTLCGCSSKRGEKEKLSVIATIFPAYDFAREIVGENADVTMLLAPGEESHTFEPTPRQMIDIQECDLFIYTGGESDKWVENLLSSKECEGVKTVRMIDCVEAVEEEFKEGMQVDADHDYEHDHEHTQYDEHVWTSPMNSVEIVKSITEALCETDADNAGTYNENFRIYSEKLIELDASFRKIADSIDNKTFVFADRFPFRYFADEYGFDYYAAFPGCSSNTEPSSKTMVFLIEKISEEKLPAVFCTEFSNQKIADTICSETGAEKYTLYSCHNVSQENFERGVTYIELMENNAKTLKEAFES